MSEAFESIRRGLGEALAHARGAGEGAQVHQIEIPQIDVAGIRARTGLSQAKFARSIGVALGTLQGWEQGRRRPAGPARVLLALIDRQPHIVQRELGR